MIALDRLADLKEVLLTTPIVVINKKATRVPLVFSVVEHLKLDECGLSCLHSCMVDVFWHIDLLGDVLNVR